MPIWPGGPCPECGEVMPEKLVHCQSCRALLNNDLESDSVEVPQFQPLQEIHSMIEAAPEGYYVECPNCERELRISKKFQNAKVQCKFCKYPFHAEFSNPASVKVHAFFSTCPHCEGDLRADIKYIGEKVACKFCHGHIHLVSAVGVPQQP